MCAEGGDLGGEEDSDKEYKESEQMLLCWEAAVPPPVLVPWWSLSWALQVGAAQVCLPTEMKQFKGLQQ